jgi:ATP-binding cassette, subfamily C, bacterial
MPLPEFLPYNSRRVKTPTVIQMEATECGAAALGIILSYYGRIVPLAELRVECGVSRDGSHAANLVLAARRYGMIAAGYAIKLEHLPEVTLPCIAFWNFNHFLVVEGYNRSRVFLNDPGGGRRQVSWKEFTRGFTGVILEIEPGPDFTKGGHQPNVFLSLIDRLRGSVGEVLYLIIAGFLLVVPGLALPVFGQIFVDRILVESHTNWLQGLLLGMSFATLLESILILLRLRLLRKLKVKLAVVMSARFYHHVLKLPARFYAQRYAGEIANRVDINTRVAEILSGQLATTVIDAVMVVFYGAIAFAYDSLLTLIGISSAIANILVLKWMSQKRVDANMRLLQEQGRMTGVGISAIQSIETIKASGLESEVFTSWSGSYANTTNIEQELEVYNQILGTVPTLLTALTTTMILIVGGWRVMSGGLTIGMLFAFQILMSEFQAPVNTLVQFANLLQELKGDLTRLDDVLDNSIDVELEPRESTASQTLVQLTGRVDIKNITFGYSPVAPPLIEDFSLSLEPGQRKALVGATGSGKSTIAKLICGLYQPWQGEILFDGIPRTQIPRLMLARSLSFVEQEILQFEGTVRDNLTLWDGNVPEEQLIKACKDALIHDVVMEVLGGYDAKLLERSANLSGGQRQRLEIARALVNNPTILVMDEATSALDAETERLLVANLRQRQCSCIVVAHRLSTIADCDEIIVFDRGRVVQRGTHEQLCAVEGVYQDLLGAEAKTLARD